MRKGFVLTFHSNNISGNTYQSNDHVALDQSLALIERLRLPVLRLADVAAALRDAAFSRLPARFVCITFDDGTDYDWKAVPHPVHGVQEPMIRILQRHSTRLLGLLWRRRAVATSFVIASPMARKEMAGPENPLSDDWWAHAQSSGFMDIGSHGWNHVHPAVSEMRECPELIEAFGKIATADEARKQIEGAAGYIRAKAGEDSARLFAYPYGQVSEYLANEYLPAQKEIRAAFTTEDRPLLENADIWRLPRFVCGWHWKSNDDLEGILSS
jgi:peptidoglycan/xylan/chitin deacetylase (PgdA/CDA1 family)